VEDSEMRILRFPRFVAAAALAVSMSLVATSSALAAGADIYGVGGGSLEFGTGMKYVKFAFSAHSGPKGDFGSLRWTVEDPNFPLDVHVDIDCVNLTVFPPGEGGFIGGTVTRVYDPANFWGIAEGEGEVFGINDLGNPSGLTPDEFFPYFGADFPDQFCKDLAPFNQTPIDQGNININLG
jgi:hypothetical protein